MFKDAAAGKQIEEFVGLRSKLYLYRMAGEDHKKCKDVKKNVVKKAISHEDYKDCLFTRRHKLRITNVIRSYHHDICTEEVKKVALSADDDTGWRSHFGIRTLFAEYRMNVKEINVEGVVLPNVPLSQRF